MPKTDSEAIYALARALLPMLDESTRSRIETLLAQAESGDDPHVQILEILGEDEARRELIQALLEEGDSEMRNTLGLYGNPFTHDTDICYLCSEDGGHYVAPDDVEERDALDRALCPTHHVPMKSEKPCPTES